MKRTLIIIAAVIVTLLGGLGVIHEARILQRAHASASWPKAIGTFQSVTIETNRTKTTTGKWLAVQYTYEVDGVRYTSKNLWPPGMHSGMDGDEVDRLATQWQPGTTVAVSYDPTDHAASAIFTGLSWRMTGNLLLVLATFGGGLAMLVLERPRKTKPA